MRCEGRKSRLLISTMSQVPLFFIELTRTTTQRERIKINKRAFSLFYFFIDLFNVFFSPLPHSSKRERQRKRERGGEGRGRRPVSPISGLKYRGFGKGIASIRPAYDSRVVSCIPSPRLLRVSLSLLPVECLLHLCPVFLLTMIMNAWFFLYLSPECI